MSTQVNFFTNTPKSMKIPDGIVAIFLNPIGFSINIAIRLGRKVVAPFLTQLRLELSYDLLVNTGNFILSYKR